MPSVVADDGDETDEDELVADDDEEPPAKKPRTNPKGTDTKAMSVARKPSEQVLDIKPEKKGMF